MTPTLATDTTADQLLDYLASDGKGNAWTYFADLTDWNRYTTCAVNGISSAGWPASWQRVDSPEPDARRWGCNYA